MSVKRISAIVALLLITSTLLSGTLSYFGGEQTDGDDFSSSTISTTGAGNDIIEIRTLEELDAIRNDLTAHYVLVNGIDASATSDPSSPFWNDGAGWEPLGQFNYHDVNSEIFDNGFSGSFDGNGFYISGLFMNRPDHSGAGLFSFIAPEGLVSNLSMIGVDMNGYSSVGSLVGFNSGMVYNCTSFGVVSGNISIGGLVGKNEGGSIFKSHFCGEVQGFISFVGGLVGWNLNGNIFNSYAVGDIKGVEEVGGLVGNSEGGIIQSYATGNVSGDWYVGGLVGWNYGVIDKSYTIVYVNGDIIIGGLVGLNLGWISESYASGYVIGNISVGGLIGSNNDSDMYGTVDDSFWDSESSGQTVSSGGTGKTTAEMMSSSTYEAAEWDFVNVWKMDEGHGYPVLLSFESMLENEPLVAHAGPDHSVAIEATVIFNGSSSYGNVGVINYTWTFDYDSTTVTLYGAIQSFQFGITGDYIVTLTVRDVAGNIATDTMTVTVGPINILEAVAGPDIHLDVGDTAYFIGGNSRGDIIEWAWSFNDGDVNHILYGKNQSHQFNVVGDWYVELRVWDSDGDFAYDHLYVHVQLSYVITIEGPNEGDSLPFEFSWSSDDASHQLTADFEIFRHGNDHDTTYLYDLSSPYTIESLPDGSYAVIVKVHDGDVFLDSRQFYIVVDETPPEIIFYYPWEGAEVTLPFVIFIDAIDDVDWDLTSEYRIDGGEWTEYGSFIIFAVHDLELGEHTLEVRAADRSGNVNQSSINFTVVAERTVYPVEIWTLSDLDDVRNDLSGDYILMADINGSETANWNDGKGFQPLGELSSNQSVADVSKTFTGTFNGNGYVISNLHVENETAGLFGVVGPGGYVDNLIIADAKISGEYAGAITGLNAGGVIVGCTVMATVEFVGLHDYYEAVGGLVGNNAGLIENCRSSGTVHGSGGLVASNVGYIINSSSDSIVIGDGGLVGDNRGGTIMDSHSTGDVWGHTFVGGLVGENSGTVIRCHSTSNVNGTDAVGGLIGYNYGSVSDSYSTGNVFGLNFLGGLIGYQGGDGTVNRTYSIGLVQGDTDIGGLIGKNNEGYIEVSFWDVESSRLIDSDGGIGKETFYMMSSDTYVSAGWDFENVWTIDEQLGYPVHISAVVIDDDEAPVAHAGDDQTVDDGVTVTFDASASTDNVGIVNYTWSFNYDGDEEQLYGISPSFKFDVAGVYEVTLTVKDAAGNSATDNMTVTVIAPLVADAGTDLVVEVGSNATLDAGNSSNAVTWTWLLNHDVQDHILYGEKVNFIFDVVGVHYVTLIVTDGHGNEDSDNITVTVTESFDREAPVAHAGDHRSVDLNALVTFDGSASTDNVGVVSYHWTITDPDGNLVFNSSSVWFSYRFNVGGNHSVTLTVADAAGNNDNATVYVFVDDNDTTDPRARAGPDVNIGMGGLVVFDGYSSWDDVGIVNYTWTFTYDGTETILYDVSPVFRFNTPGVYEVTLTVRDAAGNWDEDTMTVTVEGDTVPPIARAGADRTIGNGDAVVFDGSNSWDNVAVTSYTWTFTEGGVDKVLHDVMPIYRFNEPGVYVVTLKVTDAAGNWDEDTMTVTVNADTTPPIARAGPDRIVEDGEWVVFDGSRSWDNVAVTAYGWTISGDGPDVHLDGMIVMHRFTTAGDHTITLNVSDAAGNWNATSVKVTVVETGDTTPPIANIAFERTDDVVVFDGIASWDDVGITNYTWNLSRDGVLLRTMYGEAVFHVFTEPGEYSATLTVKDAAGNTGNETVIVSIYAVGSTVRSLSGDLSASASVNETVNIGTVQVLDASASAGATSYTWTIIHGGDVVAELEGEVAIYRFNETGDNTVILNVSDGLTFDEDTVTVTVLEEDDIRPISRPGSDEEVDVGTAVAFDGSRSWDNVGVTAYEWTILLDGDVIHTHDGVTFTYRFDDPGVYVVSLNVSDAAGNWHNRSLTMTVNPEDIVDPVALMDTLADVNVGALVVMDGTASYDNVAVIAYEWTITKGDFVAVLHGDLTSYRFDVPGVYVVSLNVSDAAGNWNVTERTFAVNDVDDEDPVAVAHSSHADADVNAVVSLDASASYDNVAVIEYKWTISGEVADVHLDGMTVTYRFNAAGDYVVYLNVSDAAGNWNITTLKVTVTDIDNTPPISDAGDNGLIRQGQVFPFDGSRSWDNVAVTNHTWVVDINGQTVTLYGETPSHVFLDAGTYTVTLTVRDGEGNEDTDTITVTVLANWSPIIESETPVGPVGDDEFIIGWSIEHTMQANESVTWCFSSNASFLEFSAVNGTFWGTPTEVGSYHVTVTATSVNGTMVTEVTYHINVTDRVLVSGTVLDADGQPLEGVALTVNGVQVGLTDTKGVYAFLIDAGTHTMNATKYGYELASISLTAASGVSNAVEPISLTVLDDGTGTDGGTPFMYIGAAAVLLLFLTAIALKKRFFT